MSWTNYFLTVFQARQNAITKYIDKACEIFKVAEYVKKEMKSLFEETEGIPLDAAALAAFAIVTDREPSITDKITLEEISIKCGVNKFKIQNAKTKIEK